MESNNNKFKLLSFVFSNVSDWLKFAEAKNAMLIAFNGASIFGFFKLINYQILKECSLLQNYLIFVIITLIFSTILCLMSFAPRLKIINVGIFNTEKINNVLFFEYLKGKNKYEIIKEITEDEDCSNYSKLEKDIAEQIKQISIITSKKYSYFSVAVWITISAYITILFAVLLFVFNYLND